MSNFYHHECWYCGEIRIKLTSKRAFRKVNIFTSTQKNQSDQTDLPRERVQDISGWNYDRFQEITGNEGPMEENAREQRTRSKRNKEVKYERINVSIVQGYSTLFSKLPEPLHSIIQKFSKENTIPSLRAQMAYRKFQNLGLGDLIESDLSGRLKKTNSLDYMERPWNCHAHCRKDWNELICKTYIMYEVPCKHNIAKLIFAGMLLPSCFVVLANKAESYC